MLKTGDRVAIGPPYFPADRPIGVVEEMDGEEGVLIRLCRNGLLARYSRTSDEQDWGLHVVSRGRYVELLAAETRQAKDAVYKRIMRDLPTRVAVARAAVIRLHPTVRAGKKTPGKE